MAKKKTSNPAKVAAKAKRTDRPTSNPRAAGPAAAKLPEPEPPVSEPGQAGLPVAGIGASAGGLDAFKKFFSAMPADSGIAFVLIPHLDPRHESLMVELISRHTKMPVAEAQDGAQVEANHVYIIPPNKYMTISGGVLRLSGPVERGGPQTSIDLFLRSLGDDKQEQAICIILSGTGAHGTLGLKAVKAAGGLAMVQDPLTAEYPAMPQSAIATDLADYVLPVEKMPPALIAYVQHCYINGSKSAAEQKEAGDDLNQVLALLRARSKLDFRHYRKKMLARRVERRMSLCHFDRMADYMAFLREHPDEVRHLSRDLLISVTSFFRDPEAWNTLETQVIAPLVRGKEPDEPLRVWCAGCATGEEAYSLGILLLERLAAAQKNCPVQIFATDVDEESLDVARRAVYPESISADVSPERLSRFFTRASESSYQISKQLRETVIFARQNVITDAPFSKLDLVVCRNLLIYLEQEVQKKVIDLLHFALLDGGCLFLGSSETIGRSADLFEPLAAKWRIYRRIGPSRANNMQFPVAQIEPRQPKTAPAPAPGKPPAPPRLPELAQNFLLRRFALACVVINRNYEVLHFAGPTEDYLIQPGGPPTRDLLSLARPGLESKLRLVVQRAIRENSAQGIKNVMMRHGNVSRRVNIDVEPLSLSRQTEGLLLIAFHEQPGPAGETLEQVKTRTQTAESDLMRQLEQELETTREDLQSTIEELESSNEELKASNEEIMSMNEELQSANEELETSKEELQSLNEELNTVNNQLQDKVQDLETANNDITNLFNCTDIATVFLDSGFRIRRFTPASTRLFKIIATDIGRPLADVVKTFTDDDLLHDARHVLTDLAPCEKEVPTEEGRWCARRIIPYRTLDDRIDGVVITFADITERKLAADAVVRRLAAIVESSADAIYSNDLDGTIQTWNRAAERLYGYTRQEALGGSIRSIIPEDRLQEWADVMARLARGEQIEQFDTERICKEGRCIPVSLTYSPLCDAGGRVISASVIARSMAERRAAQEALRHEHELTESIINTAPSAILLLDQSGRILRFNPFLEQLTGRRLAEVQGHDWFETFLPQRDRETVRALFDRAVAGEPTAGNVNPIVTADGRERDIEWYDARIPGPSGQTDCLVCIGHDITDRQRAEQALRESEERLQAILNTAADAIVTIDRSGIIQSVNPATERMFGYSAAELLGQNVKRLMPPPYRDEHDGYLARYLQTGEKRIIGIGREVQGLRNDGSTFPVDLAVSEIDHLQLFTGIIRDVTHRKELEREVLEIASLEQQRIGQDLHDSVGQEMTALSILAGDLAETLRAEPLKAQLLIDQLTEGLQRTQTELRAVLRGLLPVPVDSEGLMAALTDLAARVQQEGKAACRFECPKAVSVGDNLVATHLFLVAQEAVHNALKHARPTSIEITLLANERLILRVQDDGPGMPADAPQASGLGLRIMRNRAAIIGALLTIEPAQPTGTLVTCTLPTRHAAGKGGRG